MPQWPKQHRTPNTKSLTGMGDATTLSGPNQSWLTLWRGQTHFFWSTWPGRRYWNKIGLQIGGSGKATMQSWEPTGFATVDDERLLQMIKKESAWPDFHVKKNHPVTKVEFSFVERKTEYKWNILDRSRNRSTYIWNWRLVFLEPCSLP